MYVKKAVPPSYSKKYQYWKTLAIFSENTRDEILQKAPPQLDSWEICEIFLIVAFVEHLLTDNSASNAITVYQSNSF